MRLQSGWSCAGVSRLLQLLALLAAWAVLMPALMSYGVAADADPALPDPVAIQRLLVPADKLTGELEKVKKGTLVQLPRAEFEERVQAAARAAQTSPPQLAEARYQAVLGNASLVGTAEWKVVQRAAGPGILALAPFGIALRDMKWSDDKDAILGELEPRKLGLLVEDKGERLLKLAWSCRATPEQGGLRFNLSVPPCAIAVLELELPADRFVTAAVPDSCLVTGPLPASKADRRIWRISFAGRAQLGFIIGSTEGPAPLLLGRLRAAQEVTPGQITASFDFDLQALHSGVKELRCECPATLQPVEVLARNLEGWELKAGAKPTDPGLIIVRLREPFLGGLPQSSSDPNRTPELHVKCLGVLPSDQAWTSPTLRLLNMVPRGETLSVKVHPEVWMEKWESGDYRLDKSEFTSDGSHILSLSRGLEAGPNPTRPSAQFRTTGVEFRTRERQWWQVNPEKGVLVAEITWEATRGRLFALPIRIPEGWEVEAIDSSPSSLTAGWNQRNDKGGTFLLIDLERPLEPGVPIRLNLRLRSRMPSSVPAAGQTFSFPDVVPMGVRLREGALGISISSAFQAVVSASTAPRVPGIEKDAPWGSVTPDYYFVFRGQAIEGSLQIKPRPVQVRARCSTDVALAAGRVRAVSRLELQPNAGRPETIDLLVSGNDPGPWEWKTIQGPNSVVRCERSPALDIARNAGILPAFAGHPLGAVVSLFGPAPVDSLWRLVLDQPLTEPLVLEASIELPRSEEIGEHSKNAGDAWCEIPLITIPAVERMDGAVTVHLLKHNLLQIETAGLQEATVTARSRPGEKKTSVPKPADQVVWRNFRYGHAPVSLKLRGQVGTSDPAADAIVDTAWLSTRLDPSGRLLHHYRFRIWGWGQQTMPVRLSAGARLVAVRRGGRWLERLPTSSREGFVEIELPIDARVGVHVFEVVYATEASESLLWEQLEAAAPLLPVQPVTFRRTWRLPIGTIPVAPESFRRLPDGLGSGTASGRGADLNDKVAVAAEQEVRRLASTGPKPLDKLLELLAVELLRERVGLIIDEKAFKNAGLTASRLVQLEEGKPFWHDLGLAAQSSGGQVVLTSIGQADAWRVGLPESVAAAILEAAEFSQDSSGRFQIAGAWTGSDGPQPNLPAALAELGQHEVRAAWTEWEPLTGNQDTGGVMVVRQQAMTVTGLLIALVFAGAAFVLRDRPRPGMIVLLAGLAGFGFGLIWLPDGARALAWWPALTGLALALLACIRSALSLRTITLPSIASLASGNSKVVSGSIALVMIILAGLTGRGQAPTPSVVFLVPGNGGNEKPAVLAPADLLTQLDALIRRAKTPVRGPVLIAAHYEGKVEGQTARLEARFSVHSFTNEAATMTLSLAGIQLTDGQVDGKPAQLTALHGAQDGYLLDIKGKGPHIVVVRFQVPITGNGGERDLRFTVPELLRSRLILEVPVGAGFLQNPEARGEQRIVHIDNHDRLEVDLGPSTICHARWRTEGDTPKATTIAAKEAYYWDFQPAGARLRGVVQFSVTKGWASTFDIDVPADLEVMSVEANPSPRLKYWQVKQEKAGRKLQLIFQEPVTSHVNVLLDLVPRQPCGRTALLSLPVPRAALSGPGLLACRIAGLSVAIESQGLTSIKDQPETAKSLADRLIQPWKQARQEDLPPPTHLFHFSRPSRLQLTLVRPPSGTHAEQELKWRVGLRQAFCDATVVQTAPANTLALVNYEVPAAVVVADVSGPDVRQWSRSGSRVQIWLQRSVSDEPARTTFRLTGWMPRVPDKPQLSLPGFRIVDVGEQKTTVQVTAAERLAIAPTKLRNLTGVAGSGVPGQEWTYTTNAADFGGEFRTDPAEVEADVRLLTFVEVRGREIRFTTSLEAHVRQGYLQAITVRLRNWEGTTRIENTSPGIVAREHTGPGRRTWVLDLPSGARRFRATITGSVPIQSAPEFLVPDVQLEAATSRPLRIDHWLAVQGTELVPEGIVGLSVEELPRANQAWPDHADLFKEKACQVWKVATPDWRLRLRPGSPTDQSALVQLFLTEHAAVPADNRRWVHHAALWLYHEPGADLNVTLPSGGRLLAASIDGNSAPVFPVAAERYWLPLPRVAGARLVRLTWTFPEEREPFLQPLPDPPRLDGVPAGPVTWQLWVPTGFQTETRFLPESDMPAQPVSPAGLSLTRARSQLRALEKYVELMQRDTETPHDAGLSLTLERLERLCRQAGQQQKTAALVGQPSSANPALAGEIQDVLKNYQILVQRNGLDDLKSDEMMPGLPAEPCLAEALGASPMRGKLIGWQTGSGENFPRVQLVALDAGRSWMALAWSGVLLVLLVAATALSGTFGRAAWPEYLALLAFLSWIVLGPIPGLAALILLGGTWIVVRIRVAWQRPTLSSR